MTEAVYYEKRGRRYFPVRWYDSTVMESFPQGAHMVVVSGGEHSYRYNVNPDHAAVLAALRLHRSKMREVIRDASAMKVPKNRDKKIRQAYKAFADVLGYEGMLVLDRPSAENILTALENAIVEALE